MKVLPFLTDRGVVSIKGKDRVHFLQGLITNDIMTLNQNPVLYTAMLNPQGKYLFDFFVIALEDQLLLDIEKDRIALLIRYFNFYKLKSAVSFADISAHYQIAVFLDNTIYDQALGKASKISHSILYKDPRLPKMGWRFLVDTNDHDLVQECMSPSLYRLHRIQQGIAEGSQELIPEKSIILEYGFDALQAISWNKGCYLGQELMARTKHRGMLHKRLFFVESDEDLPPMGTIILVADQKIGEIRQTQDKHGLALLRCEEGESLQQLQQRLNLSTLPMTVKPTFWSL